MVMETRPRVKLPALGKWEKSLGPDVARVVRAINSRPKKQREEIAVAVMTTIAGEFRVLTEVTLEESADEAEAESKTADEEQ